MCWLSWSPDNKISKYPHAIGPASPAPECPIDKGQRRVPALAAEERRIVPDVHSKISAPHFVAADPNAEILRRNYRFLRGAGDLETGHAKRGCLRNDLDL